MSRFSTLLLLLLTVSMGINFYLYFVVAVNKVLPDMTVPVVSRQTITQSPSTKSLNRKQSNDETANIATTEQANHLFDQSQFTAAVAVYEELHNLDEQATIGVKKRWHDLLRASLKAEDYQTIDDFMTALLQSYPYDLTFLALKADRLAATDNTEEAISIYFSLISNTFEIRQEEYFQARIHHLAQQKLAKFKSTLSWQAIIDFADQLMQTEAGYPPYIVAQAEAFIYLEDFDSAQQLLEPLLDISFYREQAQSLLTQIDKIQLHQTAIKLQVRGEHYLVNGQINQSSAITLMIDTGASVSVLTRTMFDEIANWTSPEYLGDTLLNTAGGQVNAPIYQFERFEINEFYVDKMSFVVMDIENMTEYHGLLGMNFLKQFQFQIDQENNLLILSP